MKVNAGEEWTLGSVCPVYCLLLNELNLIQYCKIHLALNTHIINFVHDSHTLVKSRSKMPLETHGRVKYSYWFSYSPKETEELNMVNVTASQDVEESSQAYHRLPTCSERH